MGKGDIRTKRGKIYRGSHGIKRSHGAPSANTAPVVKSATPKAVAKTATKTAARTKKT